MAGGTEHLNSAPPTGWPSPFCKGELDVQGSTQEMWLHLLCPSCNHSSVLWVGEREGLWQSVSPLGSQPPFLSPQDLSCSQRRVLLMEEGPSWLPPEPSYSEDRGEARGGPWKWDTRRCWTWGGVDHSGTVGSGSFPKSVSTIYLPTSVAPWG